MTAAPTGTPAPAQSLVRDALTVLQPGFTGTSAPDWLLRQLAEGLGAVALFARNIETPAQVAALTAELRAVRPDVLVAADEEGGDVTRLEARGGSSFPGNLALGAVDDVKLTRAVAAELGRRLADCGVNLNWAPSADVNSDPDNPVIGVRSFGADPELVARNTAAYVEGLQSAGVAACVKHFPGHGDTATDSHHAVPRIDVDLATLHARELVPFRAALAAGSKVVMSAHILVPALDPELPATLSPAALTGLLRAPRERGGLGYDGLIVTDGIEMQAISATYGIERGTVMALAAGADAICVGGGLADEETVLALRDAIVTAVESGDLPRERLADAAARVRDLAAWAAAQRPGAVEGTAPGGRHTGQDPSAQTGPGAAHAGEAFGDTRAPVAGQGAATGAGPLPGDPFPATPTEGGAFGSPSEVGLEAARRALRVTRADGFTPLDTAPYVAAFTPVANIAVGEDTPWGVAAELARLLPGTETSTYRVREPEPEPDEAEAETTEPAEPAEAEAEETAYAEDGEALAATVLQAAADRRVVAVVRDAHRHPWMSDALTALVTARPGTIVVEMGVPQAPPTGALHLATHGAARVCGEAAAEAIVNAR